MYDIEQFIERNVNKVGREAEIAKSFGGLYLYHPLPKTPEFVVESISTTLKRKGYIVEAGNQCLLISWKA